MKSLGVFYWYVAMPQFGCVEHGIWYITFYVQKHIAHLAALFWFPVGLRRAARGARICETPLLNRHKFLSLEILTLQWENKITYQIYAPHRIWKNLVCGPTCSNVAERVMLFCPRNQNVVITL